VLQIRAELSTHIQMETGPHDPHTIFGVFVLRRLTRVNPMEHGFRVNPLGPTTHTHFWSFHRAECVCEAESELESVALCIPVDLSSGSSRGRERQTYTQRSGLDLAHPQQ